MTLYEVAANVLRAEIDTLGPDSSPQNTPNWDSLRHIELILAVESAFNLQFSIAEIVNMQKLGDMAKMVDSKSSIGAPAGQRVA